MLLQCVSGTKADEQEGATAERGIHVLFLTVDRKAGSEQTEVVTLVHAVLVKSVPNGTVVVILVTDLAVLEEAAAPLILGETAEAHTENNCHYE